MRTARTGFTLIEMLVALALVSLMSVAMLEAYRFSQRTLAQTTRVDAAARDIAGAQRLLRRILEHAYPFETAGTGNAGSVPRGLSGDPQEFALSAPASAHMGGVGYYRYAVGLNDDGALEVSWTLDRNGYPSDALPAAPGRETLLADVQSFAIDYLELIERSDGQVEPNWRDSWIGESELPALIRIRVNFRPGDRREWPELMVAPRISTDANCIFDVVSQMCRIAS